MAGWIDELELHVADICFSKKVISKHFDNGSSLKQLCWELIYDKIVSPHQLFMNIWVVKKNGRWIVVDGNRRLFVWKFMHNRGMLNHEGYIPVNVVQVRNLQREINLVEDKDVTPQGRLVEKISEILDDAEGKAALDDFLNSA